MRVILRSNWMAPSIREHEVEGYLRFLAGDEADNPVADQMRKGDTLLPANGVLYRKDDDGGSIDVPDYLHPFLPVDAVISEGPDEVKDAFATRRRIKLDTAQKRRDNSRDRMMVLEETLETLAAAVTLLAENQAEAKPAAKGSGRQAAVGRA